MTADAAIRGIREADSYGSIGLVGARHLHLNTTVMHAHARDLIDLIRMPSR